MTDKEIYCMGRAEYLNDTLGIPLTTAYSQAEEEWSNKNRHRSHTEDNHEECDFEDLYSDNEWNETVDFGGIHNAE